VSLIKEAMAPIRLAIRVTPRASNDELCGWRGQQLAVKVTAAPVKGAANKAVIKLLAKTLGLRAADISIISGQSSRDKTLAIVGCSRQELLQKLRELVPE